MTKSDLVYLRHILDAGATLAEVLDRAPAPPEGSRRSPSNGLRQNGS